MVHPSTANALNKRAANAAYCLSKWANELQKELNAVTKPVERPRFLGPKTFRPEKIELYTSRVENMIQELHHYSKELARFSKPA